MCRVLIGAPLSNEEEHLPAYFKSILELDYDPSLIALAWFVNNSSDKTYDLVLDFMQQYETRYDRIQILYSPEVFTPKTLDKRTFHMRFGRRDGDKSPCDMMAVGKNWLKTCITAENFVLYVEGDIILRKDTLCKLIACDKDIVGALCRTGVGAFNFMDYAGSHWTRKSNGYPKCLSQVDYIGGPVLYRAEIYKELPFVKTSGVGEDAEAMLYCMKNNISRWIEPDVKLKHDHWEV